MQTVKLSKTTNIVLCNQLAIVQRTAMLTFIAFLLMAFIDASPVPELGDIGDQRLARRFEYGNGVASYMRPLNGYIRGTTSRWPMAMRVRYEKRHFDSLAGQSLGKRSGGATVPEDLFRPYNFYGMPSYYSNTYK